MIPSIPPKAPKELFDGISVFLQVARHKSFRIAAESLGLSQSAVGQSIRQLEARLGVTLLARTTRTVNLTEAGALFLPHAIEAAGAVDAGMELLGSLKNHHGGTLRLTMAIAVAQLIAPMLLTEFHRAYPNLDLEIHAEDRVVDIVAEGFDAALRIGELIAKDMVAVRISPPFSFAVVASPDYLKRYGMPNTLEDLSLHRCIRYRRSHTQDQGISRWNFVRDGKHLSLPVGGGIIINNAELNILAAKEGAGLAYTVSPLAQPHLDDGSLISVLDDYLPQSEGVFICYPSRRQSLPKLQAFIAFAKEVFKI